MSAISLRFQVDPGHLFLHESSVMARAHGLAGAGAARKQPIILSRTGQLQPDREHLADCVCDLERHRPAGLLLDDRRALSERPAWGLSLSLTRSHPRSLASIPQSNKARSRTRPTTFSCCRIAQTYLALRRLGSDDAAAVPGPRGRAEQIALCHGLLLGELLPPGSASHGWRLRSRAPRPKRP